MLILPLCQCKQFWPIPTSFVWISRTLKTLFPGWIVSHAEIICLSSASDSKNSNITTWTCPAEDPNTSWSKKSHGNVNSPWRVFTPKSRPQRELPKRKLHFWMAVLPSTSWPSVVSISPDARFGAAPSQSGDDIQVPWLDEVCQKIEHPQNPNCLVVWIPLKHISQLGWLFPIYGKTRRRMARERREM